MEEKDYKNSLFNLEQDLRVFFFGLVKILQDQKSSKICLKNQLFSKIVEFSEKHDLC